MLSEERLQNGQSPYGGLFPGRIPGKLLMACPITSRQQIASSPTGERRFFATLVVLPCRDMNRDPVVLKLH